MSRPVCIKTQARMDALVEAEIRERRFKPVSADNSRNLRNAVAAVGQEVERFRGGYNDGSGLTGLQSARAHRAAMTPERRAELDREWDA
jgi:hypothetical protein